MKSGNGPLRVGIGGPVGSGKTALTEKLCKAMRDQYSVAVVTNDIYTTEDAEALMRMQALPSDRIVGVETGGCPHTAIREDATINLQAIAGLNERIPDLDVVFIESGGDNLAATFSPDLAGYARPIFGRRRHKRHLHDGGCRGAHAHAGLAIGSDRWCGDRRLPAYGNP